MNPNKFPVLAVVAERRAPLCRYKQIIGLFEEKVVPPVINEFPSVMTEYYKAFSLCANSVYCLAFSRAINYNKPVSLTYTQIIIMLWTFIFFVKAPG